MKYKFSCLFIPAQPVPGQFDVFVVKEYRFQIHLFPINEESGAKREREKKDARPITNVFFGIFTVHIFDLNIVQYSNTGETL